ncbi:MAG: transposase [Planctomycetes bacterium]|uniref:transposase n=1 Tax=Candidatus Wunengus sp. YC65 TaxID=3367701 RepID=UPI001E0173E7|nr:transposase [Planctomycetota bacterium]
MYNSGMKPRKSIRLKGYDYSRAGAYFVTICAHNKECLFGDVVNGNLALNDFGRMVDSEWLKTAEIRKNVILDGYVIMPNHFHGIILIIDNDDNGKAHLASTKCNVSIKMEFGKPKPGSLPVIVGAFKSAVARQINLMRNTPGNEIWQHNYYERIVRNRCELDRIRKYIITNPLRWQMDKENPNGVPNEEENKFWEAFS